MLYYAKGKRKDEDQLSKKQFTANKQYSIRSKAGEEIGVGTVVDEQDDGVVVKFSKGIMTNTQTKVAAEQVIDPEAEQKKAFKPTVQAGGKTWESTSDGKGYFTDIRIGDSNVIVNYDVASRDISITGVPSTGFTRTRGMRAIAKQLTDAADFMDRVVSELVRTVSE